MPDSPPSPASLVTDLVGSVADPNASATLVFGWKNSPPFYKVLRPQLEDGPQKWFLERARAHAETLRGKRQLIEYEPEYTPRRHEAAYTEQLDPMPGGNLFADLESYPSIPTMQGDIKKKPSLYVVVVDSPKGTAYFGKRMATLQVLNGSRGLTQLLWNKDRFATLDESVATFSADFDWVVWESQFFIERVTAYHSEFRDNKALEEAVEGHAATVHASVQIDPLDDFVARCQRNPGMAAKLARVADHGIYASPIDELKDYAVEFGIDVVWDGDTLLFDGSTIEGQWAILKLLDEDRTRGKISGRIYDSNSKREVTPSAPAAP